MRRILNLTLAATAVLALSYGAVAQQQQAPPRPQAANYQIDPVHSLASFSVAHMGISHVRGQFTRVSGEGYFDGKDYKDAWIDATIDTTSIDTREPKRDAHLKSADFFDVAKYPTITFHSRRIRLKGNGHFEVVGDLTIHGVTKGALLDGTGPVGPMTDPGGNVRMGANATTSVDRRDFGLLWNKNLDNGSVLVGDQVDITLDVELVQKKPTAQAF